MNAIGASILAAVLLTVLLGSRRAAWLGIMAGVLFLTQSQQVNIAGFNLFALRFIELAGFFRVISKGEFTFRSLNNVDHALLWLYIFVPIVYCLREADGQAYMIGNSVDGFLCYFAFRGLVRELEDLRWFLRALVWLLIPYALMVIFESLTHRNAFAFIGGGMFDWTRGGRFRCVGSFRSPDLLGTLGACFIPLYIAMACVKAERRLACLGIGLCLIIVWASNSGGPLCTTAVGIVGWTMWIMRKDMRLVRRAMVGGIVLADILMKAPVWYLLAKISALTGGDGWHRSYLMDVSFRHLNLWWLFGMPIIETSDWFPYSLGTGADITNQYISFGLNAGLVAIFLFILLLKRGFSLLGKALANLRFSSPHPTPNEFLLWGLGVALATHIANWFGITYFDQSYVLWFMQLAVISTLAGHFAKPVQTVAPVVSSEEVRAAAMEPQLQQELK